MKEILLSDIFIPNSLKNDIKNIGKSNITTLIVGESGTGKEFIAKKIHSLSNRSEKDIININISAIPQDLIEKELFGSIKGAFTGSDNDYKGKFILANNSTIVLDEIADLPLLTQGKLLKVIETGIIQPIGSNTTEKVDCRIISITNKDIDELVKKGLFRKDLFYRLNVVTIKVPPLRDRVTDINSMINYYLKHFSIGENNSYFTKEALNLLLSYDWPGNLRELKNTIERAITLSPVKEITSEYLLLSSDNNVNISEVTLKEALNDYKKKYILQVLESNEWNITKSAKILDIQRTYLSKLIKELYKE